MNQEAAGLNNHLYLYMIIICQYWWVPNEQDWNKNQHMHYNLLISQNIVRIYTQLHRPNQHKEYSGNYGLLINGLGKTQPVS